MISRVCGHCGVHSHLRLHGAANIIQDEFSSEVLVENAVCCDACERLSIVQTEIYPGSDGYGYSPSENPIGFWANAGVDSCIPTNAVPEIRNLPASVKSAAADAFNCYQSEYYRPAVLMARTTIEATAKASGISSGDLVKKIDALYDRGLILESTKSAAHAIRTFGNDMAHGDLDADVTPDDTKDIVELMHLLLREVFELPEMAGKLVARAKVRREAKTSPPSADKIE